MEKPGTALQTADPPTKGSTDALKEVLFFARRALANLYNGRDCQDEDNDPAKIRLLSRENELLKKELSELEKMIEEKL